MEAFSRSRTPANSDAATILNRVSPWQTHELAKRLANKERKVYFLRMDEAYKRMLRIAATIPAGDCRTRTVAQVRVFETAIAGLISLAGPDSGLH